MMKYGFGALASLLLTQGAAAVYKNHQINSVIYSHNKYAYIHIYMFMQDTYWRNKLIRRSNKWRRKTSLTKYYLSLYCKGSKRLFKVFVWGSWRPNITEIFWPQTYGRHVVFFLFFWCSTGALGSHSAGWSATSYLQLLRSPNSIGVPEGPPRPGVAFPITSRLQLAWNSNSTLWP